MMIEKLEELQFKEKIKKGLVLVDCYADWCGPCRMLAPTIEDLAKEEKKVRFFKLNVDDNSGIAIKYGIMSIPTLLIFLEGELKEKLIGLQTKEDIQTTLAKYK